MKKEFNTPEDFYREAMTKVISLLKEKLKTLGVDSDQLPELLEAKDVNRYTSEITCGVDIILEMYEYRGIRLLEFEWSANGIKQRDINPDERDFRRDL